MWNYPSEMTTIPGYYTKAELLAVFKMSRQNFHQSGLAAVIPSMTLGRSRLYPADEVARWRHWLLARKAWIALGAIPRDERLVPPDGKIPWGVSEGDYDWDCPVCGGRAIAPPDPDDSRMWCENDGIVVPPVA